MANKESAELTEPGVGTFDDPASLVAPELSAVLVFSLLVVVAVRTMRSMPRFFSRSRSGSES